MHVTDTAFLARIGTTEVAALALADTILNFWIVVVVGLAEGMLIIIARRFGQGRDRAVGQTFNSGLLLVVLVSLLLTGTLKLCSPLLIAYVGLSYDVGPAVDAYVQIASYGIIFHSITLACAALYVGIGKTRVLAAASAILVLTNLALSYVLIFGKLGMPPLGIEGAALGELGAEVATFGFLTIYTLRRLDLRKYHLFRLERWDRKLARSVLRISSPVSLQELLEGLQWFFFFVIVEEISTEALAWSNIIYACYEVLLIPTVAFSLSTFSMVSNLIGGSSGEGGRRADNPQRPSTRPRSGRAHLDSFRRLRRKLSGAAESANGEQNEPHTDRGSFYPGDVSEEEQGRGHRIGGLVRALTLTAYLVTLPFVVLGLLFPSVILSVFTSDPAAIEGAASGLWVVLLSMLIAVPAELWSAAVSGTGDTDAALVIEFFFTAAMLVTAYVAAFVIFPFSLVYVWVSLPVAWLICLVLSYAWVKAGYWERRQI